MKEIERKEKGVEKDVTEDARSKEGREKMRVNVKQRQQQAENRFSLHSQTCLDSARKVFVALK